MTKKLHKITEQVYILDPPYNKNGRDYCCLLKPHSIEYSVIYSIDNLEGVLSNLVVKIDEDNEVYLLDSNKRVYSHCIGEDFTTIQNDFGYSEIIEYDGPKFVLEKCILPEGNGRGLMLVDCSNVDLCEKAVNKISRNFIYKETELLYLLEKAYGDYIYKQAFKIIRDVNTRGHEGTFTISI